MVKQVTFLWTNIRISQWLVYFQRLCFYPFAIFPVETILRDLADVDFRVEVCSECFVVIARIAVRASFGEDPVSQCIPPSKK